MRRIFFVVLCLLICGVSASQMRGLNRDFKYTHSGIQDENYPCPQPSNPACLHSRWDFETAVAGTYTSDTGGFVMTVNGAPVRVDDGTWPNAGGFVGGAQGMAWSFDGAADYLSRVDDGSFDMDLVNNPGGDFSVQCVVTPHSVAGNDTIIGKYLLAGNQRAWRLLRNTTGIQLIISLDGTAVTGVNRVNSVAAYRPAFITATYQYIGAANSEANIYVDNLAVTTSNTMAGPVFDTTADFTIGAYDGPTEPWEGLIHDCKIYKGVVVTEAQHDAMFAQWQGRASTFARDVVTSTASASPPAIPFAPPASGTEPFLIDSPANSFYIGSPVANSGGLYGASDLTSKWWRGSAETCAAGHPTGWGVLENLGAGAATVVVDCDTTTSVHGGTSIKFTADNGGLPKNARVQGACQTDWINQDVTLIAYGITTTGVANCTVYIYEFDTAVCGTLLVAPILWGPGDPGATWAELKGTMAAGAWNVATSSWRPVIQCNATGTAYTANFDGMMALQAPATYSTSALCTTDADADAVCTDTIHSIMSPISANGQMSINGIWRTPAAGTDFTADAFLYADGTPAANNTYGLFIETTTDEPSWEVYDNAGAVRTIAPNVLNWAADTDYTVVVRTGGNDNLGEYWNAVWDNTAAGAGAGTRNAAQATGYMCSDNAAGFDAWARNVQWFRRMLEVIP